MRGRAYAKVNLGLWITGKRPDGYHNIVTVFHLIDLYDEIEITRSSSIEVLSDIGPRGRSNLVYRALLHLSEKAGFTVGLKVRIGKKIPIGAGLGGGSSDCAFVLRAVRHFYPEVGEELVESTGVSMGADVPFFMMRRSSALARGKGDLLEPLKSGLGEPLLLYYPGFSVSTEKAYSLFGESDMTDVDEALDKAHRIADCVSRGSLRECLDYLENDFEKKLMGGLKELREASEFLWDLGARKVLLSGSGSALLGFFDTIPDIERSPEKGKLFAVRFLPDIDLNEKGL